MQLQFSDDKLWSKEAEAATLGSILYDESCFDSVLAILPDEEYFYDSQNNLIYAASLKLYTEKTGIDAVTLRGELNRTNSLEKAGGVGYIQAVMETTPSSANAIYYAKIVRDKYQFRTLIANIEQMQNILDEPIPVDEQIQVVQDLALGLEKINPESDHFSLAAEIENVAATMQDKQDIVSTGFGNIDQKIGGVSPGSLCVLAARPSVGKTTLALNMALHMAKAGKSIIFFTLEMTYDALMEQAITNISKVGLWRLKEGPTEYEIKQREWAVETLKEYDVIFHEGANTPEKQISFIRARARTHKADVVFVDYLQLMTSGRHAENRVQEVSTISRKLKLAAIRERVPIIALSQLNRQVESRTNHRPRLADLRDSGAIEQDADIVIMLHREDYYSRIENPGQTEFDGKTEAIIAKNRRGPTGIAELIFDNQCVSFHDLSGAVCDDVTETVEV